VGRLTSYGTSAQYTYNGDGLRASKSVSGVSEPFVWDTVDGLPLILQDGSSSYVTGLGGLPLEQIANGSVTGYYHLDQLGSVRAITDGAGSTLATYSYDPYGNLTSQASTVVNPFGFTGQYQDAESGLYYMRARYYDPSVGQFISVDPARATTREPYAYVSNNPVNGVDPLGRCSWNPFDSHSCEGVIVTGATQLPGAVAQDIQQGQENFVVNFQNGGYIAIGVPLILAGGLAVAGFAISAAPYVVAGAVAAYNRLSSCFSSVEQNAPDATIHGAERMADASRLSSAETQAVLNDYTSEMTQRDGASVYIQNLGNGTYNVVIQGARGIITNFKTIDQRALDNLARNYGWH
jgi:RHS repeat-associated protein